MATGLQIRRAHELLFGTDPLFAKITFEAMARRIVRFYGSAEAARKFVGNMSNDPSAEAEAAHVARIGDPVATLAIGTR